MGLGPKIKEARKEAGLTQSGLAQAIGCLQHQVSQWENDTYIPSFYTLVLIAATLNKPLEYFAEDGK